VACGAGQNSIFLALRGFRVVAIDASLPALRLGAELARANGVERQLLFVQSDLDYWRPRPGQYDAICVFRFLDRSLVRAIGDGLAPGGTLYYSTKNINSLADTEPERRRTISFLLDAGELPRLFPALEIVHHSEGPLMTEFVAVKR